MHVLFVCNGNVCRSPIAERLTRAVALDRDLRKLSAESAGVRALSGFPMEPLAAKVVTGLGGEATGFKARKLRLDMIDRADLVLAMTVAIRDKIVGMGPGINGRTFALIEAHRIAKVTGAATVEELHAARDDLALVGNQDISDPIGLSETLFCEVGDRIAEALLPLLLALNPPQPMVEPEPEPVQPSLRSDGKVLAFRRPEVRRTQAPVEDFIAKSREA
jgi:protein-tyrosine phosphatase